MTIVTDGRGERIQGRASERLAPHRAEPVCRRAKHHMYIRGARIDAGPIHLPSVLLSLLLLLLLLAVATMLSPLTAATVGRTAY